MKTQSQAQPVFKVFDDQRSLNRAAAPTNHPDLAFGKLGVLMINLGTPNAPDTSSVKRYLKQFLSDSRVIELNKILWWPILNGPILTFRSPKTARNYAKIWGEDSPLRLGTRQIAQALSERFESDQTVIVDYAMRYGEPSVPDKLQELQAKGCDRILCFALYPQYSATTTASAYDAVFNYAKKARWQPTIRTAPSYHEETLYIDALKTSIEESLNDLPWEPEVILASFHGLPKQNLLKGDPYHCQCQKSGRLLAEALGFAPERLRVTFQSRFGPAEWLKPYTDDVAEELAKSGTKRIAIISPGFAADCIETLEELAMGTQEIFEDAGGTHFHYIPCLNADAIAIDLYEKVARDNLAGWL
ncbi:MAG: ferrochelatase [Pseudomonadota bacterium]